MNEDRDDYIEKLREKLEEWNVGLDELQTRVGRAEADAESRQQERIKRLRSEVTGARERLSSVETGGSADQWDEFREGMEEARELLDEGLGEARRELED